MKKSLHAFKHKIKGVIMVSIPLGNNNDLDDLQFCNREKEVSFLSQHFKIN